MTLNGRIRQRTLKVEQLENRQMLAADLCCLGAVVLPDTLQLDDVATELAGAEVDDTPLKQRQRTNEDSDTGVGVQQRLRQRDSENG